MSSTGTLYVVAAPSGGGKTSLLNALVGAFDQLRISVSHTTRPPRPGEEEGVSYYFTSEANFQTLIAKHAFLEYAEVFGHWYGTEKQWIIDQLAAGTDVILEIDWQGARQICQQFPQTVTIFILPPSCAALHERLERRQQDKENVIEQRMSQAMNEMSHYHEFDYLIVNDDFAVALEDLKSILRARRLRRDYQTEKLTHLLAELGENR